RERLPSRLLRRRGRLRSIVALGAGAPITRDYGDASLDYRAAFGAHVDGVAGFVVAPEDVPYRPIKARGVAQGKRAFFVRMFFHPVGGLRQRGLIRSVGVDAEIGGGERQRVLRGAAPWDRQPNGHALDDVRRVPGSGVSKGPELMLARRTKSGGP